ncbi:unnamed protein product [Alopecurus aequalis]
MNINSFIYITLSYMDVRISHHLVSGLLYCERDEIPFSIMFPCENSILQIIPMEGNTATVEAAAEEKESPSPALSVRSTGDYAVGSIPTVLYVPDFISQTEQSQLLHHIYQAPAPKWKTLKNRRLQNWGGVVHEKGLLSQALPQWLTKITDRICQSTGLFPSAINHVLINEYHPNQGIMPHQDGPAYFPVVAIISLASPVVIDFSPHGKLRRQTVESDEVQESNGSCKVEGSKEADPASLSLLLMPCSLLIFKDQAYTDFLHGIQDSEVHDLDKVANISQCPQFKHLSSDNSQSKADCCAGSELSGTFHRSMTRVSLTCRLVLKVHNKLFKF